MGEGSVVPIPGYDKLGEPVALYGYTGPPSSAFLQHIRTAQDVKLLASRTDGVQDSKHDCKQ